MDRRDPWKISQARRLRRQATDAERKLWTLLRGSTEAHWRRQRLIAGYILDFYSSAARLGIELDGGQHFEPSGLKSDRARDLDLKRIGIEVLRFDNTTTLLQTRDVAEHIWRVWRQRAQRAPPP